MQPNQNQQPKLTSRRMELHPLQSTDFDFLYELNRDPEVMKYITGHPNSAEQTQKDLERYLSYPSAYQMPIGIWKGIRLSSGETVGIYMLKKLQETGEYEIGYRLKKAFWGKGLATEGAKIVLEYALNELEITRVVGLTHPDNMASGHVLQKLGLHYEKTDTFYDVSCKYYVLDLSKPYFM